MAERYFPVRVRALVPRGGFGMLLTDMRVWLDEHAGHRNYFMGGGGRGPIDATSFHFLDLQTGRAFAERFAPNVVLAVGSDSDQPWTAPQKRASSSA